MIYFTSLHFLWAHLLFSSPDFVLPSPSLFVLYYFCWINSRRIMEIEANRSCSCNNNYCCCCSSSSTLLRLSNEQDNRTHTESDVRLLWPVLEFFLLLIFLFQYLFVSFLLISFLFFVLLFESDLFCVSCVSVFFFSEIIKHIQSFVCPLQTTHGSRLRWPSDGESRYGPEQCGALLNAALRVF